MHPAIKESHTGISRMCAQNTKLGSEFFKGSCSAFGFQLLLLAACQHACHIAALPCPVRAGAWAIISPQ